MLALIGVGAPVLASPLAYPAGDAAADQRRWLLQQVRTGQASGRQALIDDALARLQRLAPNDPLTLVTALEVQLSQQQVQQAAATLQRLRTVGRGTAELAAGERLWRALRGNQQDQLQQARMLAAAGRSAQAMALYRKLFGDQPPGMQLGIEYWRLRAEEPQGRQQALERVTALDRAYPGNAALQQLRSQLLASAESDRQDAKEAQRAEESDRAGAVKDEWRRLSELPASDAAVRRLRDFIARNPRAPEVEAARKLLAAHGRLLENPAWQAGQRAQTLLEAGRNSEAEAAFRQALAGFPNNPDLIGGLGMALLRQDRRADAIVQFEQALARAPNGDNSGKWRSLIASTRYWLTLQQADAALEAKQVEQAATLYAQAHELQPKEVDAVLGLANVALAKADDAEAERRLLEARRIEPGNRAAIGKLVQLYGRIDPARMEAFVAGLPAGDRGRYEEDVRRVRQERMRAQIEAARTAGKGDEAITLAQELRRELPGDPWLAFRLANDLKAAGRIAEGGAVMEDMATNAGSDPAARYAQALYLSSIDRPDEAIAALERAPEAQWNADMQALSERLQRERVMRQVRALRDAGQEAQAIALLKQLPPSPENRLLLAEWASERGDHAQALALYQQVLAEQPGNIDAVLGRLQSWIGQGNRAAVRETLLRGAPVLAEDDVARRRQLARIWGEVGEAEREWTLLRDLISRKRNADAQLLRDAARNRRLPAPETALDLYAQAMQDAGLLAAAQAVPRDNRAMTRATRANFDDDWLKRSIRSDVEEFYQARNPTLTVMQESGRRSDGTPGFSRLVRDTRIVNYARPFAGGVGWARLEQVRMDAGRFQTDVAGGFDQDFGSCDLVLVQPNGTRYIAPKCYIGAHQRVSSGIGAALGWRNARDTLSFDIGHTPAGQAVGTWLGGVTFGGDLGKLGWSLTASRRPMTNSLLSQYGAVDPRTGIVWGGVTANGVTFSLGYDRGGRNGFWSNWGWHRISGKNVLDNDRLRAMAGWYHKLVVRPDLRVDIGLTAMAWGYKYDLGGYSLGQGGYYSPQRYASLSVPVSLMWRRDDWSVRVDASVGYSYARTDAGNRYPLNAVIRRVVDQVAAQAGQPLMFDNTITATQGSSSRGSGYRLTAAVERRLGDHWVAGVGATLQRSRDFSPDSFQFYLRYARLPWQGNLPMPVAPLQSYGEFR